ncbi:hypothetical protein JK202_03095 [Gluconobacter sp. Dm-62]|nr:hypothetical protein [Gluconobacter sp. Dm-62]MBS1102007.1 hypothetical protein [Gluconobacter sp. Dm-62]
MKSHVLIVTLFLGLSACVHHSDDGGASVTRYHASPHGAYAGAGAGWSGY